MIILSSLWAACAGPANIHKQDKSTWIWQSTDRSTCRCAIQIWQAAGQQQETHLNESMVPHAVAVTNADWAHHCPHQHLWRRELPVESNDEMRGKTSCSESFPFTVMVFTSSSVCLQPPWAKILFIIYSYLFMMQTMFLIPRTKQARAKGTWPPDRGPGSRRHSWLQFQGHLLWSMCPLWPRWAALKTFSDSSLTRFSNFCTFFILLPWPFSSTFFYFLFIPKTSVRSMLLVLWWQLWLGAQNA